jgi:hypothetical protein
MKYRYTGVLVFGLSLILFGFGCSSAKQVTVTMPNRLKVGQSPELRIDIANDSNESLEGVVVELPSSFTKGLGIKEIIPEATDTYYDAKKDLLRFTFDDLIIEDDDLETVRFRMWAKEVGSFKGNARVCVADKCDKHSLRVRLSEAAE